MSAQLARLRQWWLDRQPRDRTAITLMLVILAAIVLAITWMWVRAEQARLQRAIPAAAASLQRMQQDVQEIERLRGQTVGDALQGQSLVDALLASIRSRGLELVVKSEGTDHYRVQGVTSFDQAVAWLATVQHDDQLQVATLAASRQDGGVKIDAVLVPARR
jgi:type II secretory pathway component PulM